MRQLYLRLLPLLLVAGCSSGGGDGGGGDAGNGGGANKGNGGSGGGGPLASYNSIAWTIEDVEVMAGRHPGIQGKLLIADDGTLYYAYYRMHPFTNNACDIAVFSGGTAPATSYELRLAVKPPQGSWSVETVPLEAAPGAPHNFVTSLFGLDGLIEASTGDLLLALAAGGDGLASCGSSDAILARRTGATWDFQAVATSSGDCCDDCSDTACTSGTDVGAWATIAESPSGQLAITYVDYHNFWDEDGQSFQGYEVWHETDDIFGLDPWSGRGLYGDAVFANTTWIVAYTPFNGSGLFVARRTSSATNTSAWTIQDIQPNVKVGERISLAVAPNGTVGLAYNRKDGNDDLIYCESNDEGATWSTCQSIDFDIQRVGAYPSLVFDAENRPLIAYYACGVSNCDNNVDGLRFAFRELNGQWKVKDVHFNNQTKSGLYAQLVLHPTTGAPIIAFHDATRHAAMVAYGILPEE